MRSVQPRMRGSHRWWCGRLAVGFAGAALAVGSCASTGTANSDEPTITPQTPGAPASAVGPAGPAAVIVGFGDPGAVAGWTTVNDPVMGGRSTSEVRFGGGGLTFSGTVSLENNGGFASARGPVDPDIGLRAAGATSLRVRALGDGKTYVLRVGAAGQPWSYIQRFRTDPAVAQSYELPVGGFQAVGMRLDPAPYAPQTLDPATISQVSVYILDKQQGPFEITISAIERG